MSNTAQLRWSLEVECPSCSFTNDLSQGDDDSVVIMAIFNNNWDALKGKEITCLLCKHEFKLDSVEY